MSDHLTYDDLYKIRLNLLNRLSACVEDRDHYKAEVERLTELYETDENYARICEEDKKVFINECNILRKELLAIAAYEAAVKGEGE